MATIKQIIERRFQNYKLGEERNEILTTVEIVKDFACRFVLYLDTVGVDDKLNLNEALELFENYYDEATNISGNGYMKKI